MNNLIHLGETVVVSDPCYSIPTWCQIILKNVKAGDYRVVCIEDPNYGRHTILAAVHKDYLEDTLTWRTVTGVVGVDSGSAGIFDHGTYRNDAIDITPVEILYDGTTFADFKKRFGAITDGDHWYANVSSFSLSPEFWGSYPFGVVSQSGFGDGSYRCLVARKDKKIVAIAIDYGVLLFKNRDLNYIIQEQLQTLNEA